MVRARTILPEAQCFGAIIRRLRQERRWTIVEVAKRCGMTASHLSVLEQGLNLASLPTILDLCEALGADVGEVMREVAAARHG